MDRPIVWWDRIMKCDEGLFPPQKGSAVSYLTFLSAMSLLYCLYCWSSPWKEANLPSREVTEDCSAFASCKHPPREGAFTLPAVWTDWEAPQPWQPVSAKPRFQSQTEAQFYLNLIPHSEEHSLPLVSYLNLIPMDNNFVLWIHLAKNMIQGLLVLDWFTELQNAEKISPITIDEEPGLGKVKRPAKVKWLVGKMCWK